MRDFVLTVFFLLGGIATIYHLTDNFSTFTAESARRLAIAENPLPLSNYRLISSTGKEVQFSELKGKTLLIDFVYTRCPTVCTLLGGSYAQLQQKLLLDKSLNDVVLISISFDLGYDTPASLQAYQQRYTQTDQQWLLFIPSSQTQLQKMLAEFGVVVIDDQYGGFIHNSAIHIASGSGKLVKILDWEKMAEVEYDISSIIQ